NFLSQGLAGHKFSSNKMHVLIPPNLVNGDDIGMIERRGSTAFALEALYLCVVAGKLGGQDLDCNPAVEHEIVREIHLTHAARAQERLNFIMADPVSNERANGSSFLICFFGPLNN